MMKPVPWLALAVLLLPAAARAQTYTVDVRPDLNGLDVKIETVESTTALVVRLTNRTAEPVRCALVFDAPPQNKRRTKQNVAPGETRQVPFRARRKWFRVQVDVECR
jgi:hypothetical protein